MSYTLVIIDMQPYFPACKKVVKSVCDYINKAKKYGQPIILVEYYECSDSHKKILEAIGSYGMVYLVSKNQNNGSCEVADALKRNKLPNNLRVVGVNTSACVKDTVYGLLEYGFTNISVMKGAVADESKSGNIYTLRQFSRDGLLSE